MLLFAPIYRQAREKNDGNCAPHNLGGGPGEFLQVLALLSRPNTPVAVRTKLAAGVLLVSSEPMRIEKQSAFPRPLHGMLVVFCDDGTLVVGVAIAIMGPLGCLGGIHGREGDLDAAVFFLGGRCVAMIGLGLTIKGLRYARRSS